MTETTFEDWQQAFFEKLDKLFNELRDIVVSVKKRENKPKPKHRNYWIMKKEQKSGPKIGTGRNNKKIAIKAGAMGKNLCKKIGSGSKGIKQNFQPKIESDLPKFQVLWKMEKVFNKHGLVKRNIKPDRMNWLPCNIVKLK